MHRRLVLWQEGEPLLHHAGPWASEELAEEASSMWVLEQEGMEGPALYEEMAGLCQECYLVFSENRNGKTPKEMSYYLIVSLVTK